MSGQARGLLTKQMSVQTGLRTVLVLALAIGAAAQPAFIGYNFACMLEVGGTKPNCFTYPGYSVLDASALAPPTGNFKQLSGYARTVCGLLDTGGIKCWGQNNFVPPTETNYVQIAVGDLFICALNTLGITKCAGNFQTGMIATVPSWERWTEIRATAFFDTGSNMVTQSEICGRRANNTVSCYGPYTLAPSIASIQWSTWQMVLTNNDGPTVVLLGAGVPYGTNDGVLFLGGLIGSGQLEILANAVDIEVGGAGLCVLHTDQTVACLQDVLPNGFPLRYTAIFQGYDGMFTIDTTGALKFLFKDGRQVPSLAAVAVAASTSNPINPCAILSGGRVVCWGSNGFNGAGDVPTNVNFVSIQHSSGTGCGMTTTSHILCWGINVVLSPVQPPLTTTWKSYSLADDSSVYAVMTNGTLWYGGSDTVSLSHAHLYSDVSGCSNGGQSLKTVCGLTTTGQIICNADSSQTPLSVPPNPKPSDPYVKISAGNGVVGALTQSGALVVHYIDSGKTKNYTVPTLKGPFSDVLVTEHDNFNLGSPQTVFCGEKASDSTWICFAGISTPGTKWGRIAAGREHTCGINLETGGITCWGAIQDNNMLPPALNFQTSQPLQTYTDVACGDRFACGIYNDQKWQSSGQYGIPACFEQSVGDAETTPSTGSVGNYAFNHVSAIASGTYATCVGHKSTDFPLTGVRCWGDAGQLGTVQTSLTVTNVIVDRGDRWGCAVLADNSMICFGVDGSVGNTIPPPGHVWKGNMAAMGRDSVGNVLICALRLNSTMWCSKGVTEAGFNWNSLASVQWTDIAFGGHFKNDKYNTPWWFVGVTTAGTVTKAAASASTLSIFTQTPSATKVWLQIAAGARHYCMVASDGSIFCDGANDQGQLTPPVPLTGLSAVDGGSLHGYIQGSVGPGTYACGLANGRVSCFCSMGFGTEGCQPPLFPQNIAPQYYYQQGSRIFPCRGAWSAGPGHLTAACSGPCVAGRFANENYTSSSSECAGVPPPGFYCGAACPAPIPCAPGTFAASSGVITCSNCPVGFACPHATASPSSFPCFAGRYGNVTNLSNQNCNGPCAAGYYCAAGSTSAHQFKCGSVNNYCKLGSSKPTTVPTGCYSTPENAAQDVRTDFQPCPPGWACTGGLRTICGPGTWAPGHYSTNCSSCPLGRFSVGTGNGQCTKCTKGRYADRQGLSQCITCVAGTANGNLGASSCGTCPRGTFSGSGAWNCTACSPGTVSASPGSASCTFCPLGSAQFLSGKTSCVPCGNGTVAGLLGMKNCTVCTPGKFSLGLSQIQCQSCDIGKASTGHGATACSTCKAGKFAEGGASKCTDCPIKTYADKSGFSSCLQCGTGTANNKTGQSVCPPCNPGTFAASSGLAFCTPCPQGWANSKPGQQGCTECQAGTYATGSGNSNCTACAPGHQAPQPGASSCVACARGQYLSGLQCIPCALGKATNTTASESCAECPPGRTAFQTGQALCDDCPQGFANPSYTQQSCTQCQAGTYAKGKRNSNCTSCPSGWQSSAGASSCSPCARGSYLSQLQCLPCPTGQATNKTASLSCPQCPPGRTASQQGQALCDPCPEGFANSKYGQQSCTQCAAGTYAKGTGNANCTACATGQTSTAGASSCSPCQRGSYLSQQQCLPCPTGHATNNTGSLSCAQCPPGRTAFQQGQSVCDPCPQGYANPSYSQQSCTQCQAGTYSKGTGNANCGTCASGYQSSAGATRCTACARGTYLSQQQCLLCPTGYATNKTASLSCTKCVPGRFAGQTGQALCDLCAAGRANNAYGQQACTDCPAGKFATGLGNLNCSTCQTGYQSFAGSPVCTPCQRGSYFSQQLLQCLPCPAGSATNNTASLSCPQCPPGRTASQQGQALCDPCAEGTANGQPGQLSCVACAVGTFASGTGNANCSSCPAGYQAPFPGSAGCTACPRGSYFSQLQCLPCPTGFASNNTASESCDKCPPGRFASATGQALCTDCPAGTANANYSKQACDPCATGKFANGTGSIQCSACPAGYQATQQGMSACIACGTGTFLAAGQLQCQSCPIGYFANTTGSSTCTKCPAGRSSQSQTGQAQCVLCGTGSYSSSDGAGSCTPCEAGKFASAQGMTGCKNCLPGYAASQIGMSSCAICEAGTISIAQTQCQPCPKGSYSDKPGSSKCTECVPGKAQTQTGQTSCDVCSPPSYSGTNGSVACSPCASGTYASAAPSTGCISCNNIRGVDCSTGAAITQPGFWQYSYNNQLYVVECALPVCAGSANGTGQQCIGNRVQSKDNIACAECLPDYTQWGNNCIYCPDANGGLIIGLLIVAFIYVCLLHVLSQRNSGLTKIFLFGTQTAALVVGDLASTFTWLHFFEFNPEQSGSGGICIAPMSSYDKLVLSFIVPIGCVALLGVAALIQAMVICCKKRNLRGFPKQNYLRTIIALQLSTYQLVTKQCLDWLHCISVPPIRVVFTAATVDCDGDRYKRYLPIAYLGLAIYTAGLPLVLGVVLYRHRKAIQKHQQAVLAAAAAGIPFDATSSSNTATPAKPLLGASSSSARDDRSEDYGVVPRARAAAPAASDPSNLHWHVGPLGVMYEHLKPDAIGYEVFVLLRRTLLISIAIFVTTDNSWRSTSLAIALFFIVLIHLWTQPFATRMENTAEMVSLSALTLTAMLLSSIEQPFALVPGIALSIIIFVPLGAGVIAIVHRTAHKVVNRVRGRGVAGAAAGGKGAGGAAALSSAIAMASLDGAADGQEENPAFSAASSSNRPPSSASSSNSRGGAATSAQEDPTRVVIARDPRGSDANAATTPSSTGVTRISYFTDSNAYSEPLPAAVNISASLSRGGSAFRIVPASNSASAPVSAPVSASASVPAAISVTVASSAVSGDRSAPNTSAPVTPVAANAAPFELKATATPSAAATSAASAPQAFSLSPAQSPEPLLSGRPFSPRAASPPPVSLISSMVLARSASPTNAPASSAEQPSAAPTQPALASSQPGPASSNPNTRLNFESMTRIRFADADPTRIG